MGTPLLWVAFNAFVLGAVVLDLGVFHRRPHKISMREASLWTATWVGLAVLLGLAILRYSGYQASLEFFTGYLIEKALSVDNLFLFLVIFRTFAVDELMQHRVLEWGILGALIMRGVMIWAGVALLQRVSWILYVLGAFLIYAGIHMLLSGKEELHPERNAVLRFAGRHLRISADYSTEKFVIRKAGKLYATPLFLVLLVVEITDVTLAIDSIPAVFGITRDAFIVYSSNVLAILGLRAMYFLLARMLNRLRYLTAGLSLMLMFIGGKMVGELWVHIPVHISLLIVAGILLTALLASLLFPQRPETTPRTPGGAG
jgi:tellurite resistance protein TerC